MKRFISMFFLFLIFFVTCYIASVIIVGNYASGIFKKNIIYKFGGYGHMYSRVKESEKFSNVDVLFMGSSHSYRGFDPRIFERSNFRIFNFGSSSQSPMQQEVLINQYLNHLKPKLVVFEMYPSVFELDGVESALDILANNKIDYNSVKMCFRANNIKTYNTLIYSYYKQVLGSNKDYRESAIKKDDRYIPGGFVEKKMALYKSPPDKTNNKKVCKLNNVQLDIFKSILKNLSEKKIKYVLVQAPVTNYVFKSYANSAEIDSVFNSLGTYYNFNKLLQLNDSLFYDSHHLNQNGVIIFNNSFIEVLKKDNLLVN